MSSTVSKKQLNTCNEELCDIDQEEVEQNPGHVTTHLYLIKPSHTNGTLDKEVVLRRIRHRRRANKVKSAVGSLFNWSSATVDNSKNSVPVQIRWADDAFAAP